VDPKGFVWTVDAGDSTIRKYDTHGRELLKFKVELPAKPKGPFCGTTDIAFAPSGHLYVSDGYQNTRVIEFTADGKRIREWGKPGTGPGEFNTPHGIAIAPDGRVYVADRENGRIQWFDPNGKYLGEWNHAGKTFCLKLTPAGHLWIGTQPRNVPNGAEGWLMKLNTTNGEVVGLLQSFGHSIEVTPGGEVLTGRRPGSLLIFKP
jgi:DNA-binding beta-propeller fold protein YncE